MNNQNLDNKLDTMIDKLPSEYQPNSRRWQKVDSRLDVTVDDASKKPFFKNHYALVGAFVGVLLCGWLLSNQSTLFN